MKNINLILITCFMIFEPEISSAFYLDFGSFQLSSESQTDFDETECFLKKGVVKCEVQAFGNLALKNVPPLKNPIQLSSGDYRACVIDGSDVICWGNEGITTPALKNPTQVSVGRLRSCVVDDEGVLCWGIYPKEGVRIAGLKNPRQISMSHDSENQVVCAIDDEGVKFWRFNEQRSNYYTPPELARGPIFGVHGESIIGEIKFKNPVQVSCAYESACVVHDDGIKCWKYSGWGLDLPPEFKNPVQVSVDNRYACAIDENGIKCWGDVPKKIEPFILNKNILDSLPVAKSRFLYQTFDQLDYFRLEVYNSDNFYSNRLLTSVIAPMILQINSDYFLIEAIPKFKNWMDDVKSQDYELVLDSIDTRKIALVAIQATLNVGLSFLSGQQIDRTQDALRKVGQAMIDPMNNQNILEVLKSVESLKEEREVLLSSEKSKFLIECQQVALDWLKLKVK